MYTIITPQGVTTFRTHRQFAYVLALLEKHNVDHTTEINMERTTS